MDKLSVNQNNHENGNTIFRKYYTDSPGTAEIERLGAKLDALRNGKEKQAILITSSVLGEGKSTVASLLARSMALHQKRTLLIDFDIRRPNLHIIFNVTRKNGLIDILQSDLPINFYTKETVIPNLFLISSGILNEIPGKILNSEKIKLFFKNIMRHFDNIIVDSPPVIPVSDPLLLCKFVDEVILVAKAGSTPKYAVKRAINMFNDVKVNISGIVLNNMQNVLSHYYDSKSYGYDYYEDIAEERNAKQIVRKHGIWNWKS